MWDFNPLYNTILGKVVHMIYSSDFFSKNIYFTLYDLNDNLICYFENFYEVSRYTNLPLRRIANNFKRCKSKFIFICIDGNFYKLYCYLK